MTSDFEGIGATSWNDPGMAGSVNEFRVWSGTLSDFEVTQNFTNGPDTLPNVDDTDLDGIPDDWELLQTDITDLTQLDGTLTGPGPGPGTGDFDGDGLFDLEEFQRATHPVVNDTDTDGLLDGPEVKTHLTNPLVVDTDGDTLSDGIEVNDHGTDPTLKDSDMDLIDDNVELDNGTSPIDANDPGPFTGAELTHRWSFDTDTFDSVGGNTGVLVGGATVDPGRLSLTGLGTSTAANHMAFTTPIEVGINYRATGITIESWYTDTGTGTWGKLFQFGNNAAGQELAYTHSRGNGEMSGVDREGAKLLGEQITQNEEHHLVITVSSEGNLSTWVDGVQKITDSDTNDLANVTSDFEGIGATSWGDPGMTGSVNEFRIWKGTLSSTDVADNFATGPDSLLGGEGLSITSITRDNGSGAVTLIFKSIPGHTYQIDSSPTLVPAISPQWLDVDDSFFATGNLSMFIDTAASGGHALLSHQGRDQLSKSAPAIHSSLQRRTTPPALSFPTHLFMGFFLFTWLLIVSLMASQGATLANRWSFDTNTNDSIGGITGVLQGGATIIEGQLSLTGAGSSTAANRMTFSSPIDIGGNFGATGVTIETWYTDTGTGTWGKLFQFGNNSAGQELAYTHTRGSGQMSGIDRDGTQLLGEQIAQNEEHHLVITVSSDGNLNTWLDGVQKLTNTNTNDLSNVTTSFEAIGATSWGDPGMKGTVNEFRIWSGELTSAEVSTNLTSGPNNAPGNGPNISSFTTSHATRQEGETATFSWDIDHSSVTGSLALEIRDPANTHHPLRFHHHRQHHRQHGRHRRSPLHPHLHPQHLGHQHPPKPSKPAPSISKSTPASQPPPTNLSKPSKPHPSRSPLPELIPNTHPNPSLAFSIASPPSGGTLTGTAPNLSYTANNGFIGTDSFTFKSNDGKYDSAPATVTIGVDQAPTAPVSLSLSSLNIPITVSNGGYLAALNTNDPNLRDTHSYTLVSGAGSVDNNLFAIVGNQLRAATNFSDQIGNLFSIRLRTTDQGRLFFEQSFTLQAIESSNDIVINEIHATRPKTISVRNSSNSTISPRPQRTSPIGGSAAPSTSPSPPAPLSPPVAISSSPKTPSRSR